MHFYRATQIQNTFEFQDLRFTHKTPPRFPRTTTAYIHNILEIGGTSVGVRRGPPGPTPGQRPWHPEHGELMATVKAGGLVGEIGPRGDRSPDPGR